MPTRTFAAEVRRACGAFVIAMTLAADCDGDPVAPFKPSVVNDPDRFQFQLTAPQPLSGNAVYEWHNNGTAAIVNQVATLSAGAAQLVIRDARGAEVHRRTVTESGAFRTLDGSAGTWTVRIDFTDATGTVDVRVQRP